MKSFLVEVRDAQYKTFWCGEWLDYLIPNKVRPLQLQPFIDFLIVSKFILWIEIMDEVGIVDFNHLTYLFNM